MKDFLGDVKITLGGKPVEGVEVTDMVLHPVCPICKKGKDCRCSEVEPILGLKEFLDKAEAKPKKHIDHPQHFLENCVKEIYSESRIKIEKIIVPPTFLDQLKNELSESRHYVRTVASPSSALSESRVEISTSLGWVNVTFSQLLGSDAIYFISENNIVAKYKDGQLMKDRRFRDRPNWSGGFKAEKVFIDELSSIPDEPKVTFMDELKSLGSSDTDSPL